VRVTDTMAATSTASGPPDLDGLQFTRVLAVPFAADAQAAARLRTARVAGLLDAGARGARIAALWLRRAPESELEVYLAGVHLPQSSDEEAALAFPLGGRGVRTPPGHVSGLLEAFPEWHTCTGAFDPLARPADAGPDDELRAGAFDAQVDYLLHRAFAWLVVGRPREEDRVEDELAQLQREIYRLKPSGSLRETDAVAVERLQAWFRELAGAASAGLWELSVSVGVPANADPIASALCAAAEMSTVGYRIRAAPAGAQPRPDRMRARIADASPFCGTVELMADLVRPPENEIGGLRAITPPTFDLTVNAATGGSLNLGAVLDRHRRAIARLNLPLSSVNRHTFICGATGGGKSQTVRTLLEQLSRLAPEPIPWLVIEPAKAEYAGMAGRLADLPELPVHVLRPGDPAVSPACLNPLEPSTLEPGNPDRTFPLQAHADLVRALFMAAFRADEPFPQVLSAALTDCYEAMGWDLVTSQPRNAQLRQLGSLTVPAGGAWTPRFPRLSDLQRAARDVVESIGYDEDTKKRVRGFVDIRIGSLRHGAPGRFFEGGHPLDIAQLLTRNVVIEAESVTNDQDKAFVMGVILIRIYEQLLLEARERKVTGLRHVTVIEEAHRLLRRVESDSPVAHSIELFAGMLAEVRAYGEGLIVAEQIPSKIVTDVIKNTAVKVVHRLPADDDRLAVGATMNLSEEQSEYVVSLTPGKAAVFTDGMDRPILAAVDSNEESESTALVRRDPPLRAGGRVSPACGPQCVKDCPCTLSQLRSGERLLHEHPELTLWVEASLVAHALGGPSPAFRPSLLHELLHELARRDARVVQCAISHAVERAISMRYRRLAPYFDPDVLATHLAATAWGAVTGAHGAGCANDGGDWRAGRQRFADLAEALDELLAGQSARWPLPEILAIAERRGVALKSGNPADVRRRLLSLPWHRYPAAEQHALMVGDPERMLALLAAEALLGPGQARSLLANALNEHLQWQAPAAAQAVLAQFTAGLAETPQATETE
jgi:uncharacterized protein